MPPKSFREIRGDCDLPLSLGQSSSYHPLASELDAKGRAQGGLGNAQPDSLPHAHSWRSNSGVKGRAGLTVAGWGVRRGMFFWYLKGGRPGGHC